MEQPAEGTKLQKKESVVKLHLQAIKSQPGCRDPKGAEHKASKVQLGETIYQNLRQ